MPIKKVENLCCFYKKTYLSSSIKRTIKRTGFPGWGKCIFSCRISEVFPVHPDRRKGRAERCLTRPLERRPAGAEKKAGKEGKRGPAEEEIVCVKDITKTNLKGDLRMKRSVYEAPVTDRFQIELEGVFMSGSIVQGKNSEVQTTGHELNDIDASNYDNNGASWNDVEWK